MPEKPILFSTPMVKAILAGRKMMTRRVIKPHIPGRTIKNISWGTFPGSTEFNWIVNYENDITNYFGHVKPRYAVGDILWVRETWCKYVTEHVIDGEKYAYKANTSGEAERCRLDYVKAGFPYQWKPSIHMPRKASRLFLKVKNIRVERLQDITEEDARAEGCIDFHDKIGDGKFDDVAEFDLTARDAFAELWDGLNSKRGYGWDINPWVWVVEFEEGTSHANR